MKLTPGIITVFLLMLYSKPATSEELTLERLFGSPSLNGEELRSIKASPDGTRITYLRGKKTDLKKLDLWEYNIQSKTQSNGWSE